jgi:hypothetical protein
MEGSTQKAEEKPRKTFAEFLESTPPGVMEEIADLFSPNQFGSWFVSQPDVQLHCWSETCQGERFFHCPSDLKGVGSSRFANIFLVYRCRNCRQKAKQYALLVCQHDGVNKRSGEAIKFGEIPSFGPHIPSRVISLIGPNREFFLQGRRAENHGLGIGAFAYYRRVVENQKGRVIREIGKVAKKLGASEDVLKQFETAAQEDQFSKAIDDIKDTIPRGLLIDGHNPLKLLHSALSEGMHAQTDEECLQIAGDIRIVLTELADRISQVLKDESELKQAVGRLLNRGTDNPSK